MNDTSSETATPRMPGSVNDGPRVSVVMPFFNSAEYVEEAIESMLSQTYRALEVIAIDDGSTDDGLAIVQRIAARDQRVRVISEGKRGFVVSLNRGLALARGEYIARMDADDVSLPDRIAKQVAFLDSHPDVGVVGGQILAVLDGKVLTLPWWLDAPLDHDAIESALWHRNSIYHPTALLRRDVLLAASGYRSAFTVVQDYDLWLRLAARTRLANLPDRVLRYRFHDKQATERNHELAYLCTWSARHAARERRAGRADPVRAEVPITREQAIAWGLDPNVMRSEIEWIRASHQARNHIWQGRRLRGIAAFSRLLFSHPVPLIRRASIAIRNRFAQTTAVVVAPVAHHPDPAAPACPVSR